MQQLRCLDKMHKRYIYCLIILFVFLPGGAAFQLGCQKPPAEKPEKPEAVAEQPAIAAGRDYFLYGFGDWGGIMGYSAPGTGGNQSLNIADAESGNTIVQLGVPPDTRLMMSPDASKLLYIDIPEAGVAPKLQLIERISGHILWDSTIVGIADDWTARVENAHWDPALNRIILQCKGTYSGPWEPDPAVDTMLQQWWFITFDSGTGEQVAKLDLVEEGASGRAAGEMYIGAQYAAGRLYAVLPDFPIRDFKAYDQTRRRKSFDIYAIDPLAGDADVIDMRGMLSRPSIAKFFVKSDGASIIAQTDDYTGDGDPRPLGGSIQRIDVKSGEWETMHAAGHNDVYNLRGATPDGFKIIYTHYTVTDAGFDAAHYVQDTSTGETTELPIEGTLNQLWISPSGEYAAFYDMIRAHKLFIITVDSGEMREVARSTAEGSPLPMRFLGGLGSFK
jgi:hypothetical protein